jgi:hypothetical protein
MSCACSICGREEKYIQNICRKTLMKGLPGRPGSRWVDIIKEMG